MKYNNEVISGADIIAEIREKSNGWISLKMAADHINENYMFIDLKTFEPITSIDIYQEIIAEQCSSIRNDCPYVTDLFASGCICCLIDAINKRDDLIIRKKE